MSAKPRKTHVGSDEYVVAAFAETSEQARNWTQMLVSNEVPVHTRESDDGEIAITVPENYLDEAQIIINSEEDGDDPFAYLEDEDELSRYAVDDFSNHYYEDY